MQFYMFRSTTEKLPEHMQHITESGDSVLDKTFVGGRDWVLLCRKGEPTIADLTAKGLEVLIVKAIETAESRRNRRTSQRTAV